MRREGGSTRACHAGARPSRRARRTRGARRTGRARRRSSGIGSPQASRTTPYVPTKEPLVGVSHVGDLGEDTGCRRDSCSSRSTSSRAESAVSGPSSVDGIVPAPSCAAGYMACVTARHSSSASSRRVTSDMSIEASQGRNPAAEARVEGPRSVQPASTWITAAPSTRCAQPPAGTALRQVHADRTMPTIFVPGDKHRAGAGRGRPRWCRLVQADTPSHTRTPPALPEHQGLVPDAGSGMSGPVSIWSRLVHDHAAHALDLLASGHRKERNGSRAGPPARGQKPRRRGLRPYAAPRRRSTIDA